MANGSCLGIVNAIGMSTEVGKIQQQITEAAAEEEDTPLKKKLDVFGERLAQVLSCLQADLQGAGTECKLSQERHTAAMRVQLEQVSLQLCCGLSAGLASIGLLRCLLSSCMVMDSF